MTAGQNEPASRLAGAAISTACSDASSLGPRFVEPMGENRLGMRRCPTVRQHLVQPRIVRMQAEKKLANVTPRLDPMTLRPGEDRTQHGCSRARGLAAQEEPILSPNGLMS